MGRQVKSLHLHESTDVHALKLRNIFASLLLKELPEEYIARYEHKLNRRINAIIGTLFEKELNSKVLKKLYLVGKSLMSMGITDDTLIDVYKELKNILLEHPRGETLLLKAREAMKMLIKPYILYDIFNLDTEDLKSEIMTNYLELINRLKEKYTSHFTLLIEGRGIESLREAVQKAVEDLKSNHQTIPLYEELYPYDKLYWRLVSMYAQETDFEKSYEILKEMDRLVIGILKFLDEFLVRILSNLAFIDPLTGLYNRNFMYNALRKEISMCRRYNLPLSFVVIDVDNFKEINDTYGHSIGDRALSTLGSIIRQSVRSHDV
ncbi:MAG: GGDEF domain-containing protein, partial [Aquificaceae bacterium]|nr:GGDEF domain-containing protein [Aquificaceae bacterium]